MKRFLMLLLCAVPLFCHATTSYVIIDEESCTVTRYDKTFHLYGKVKIVDSYEDIRVKIVDSYEDVKVKIVDSYENSCGKIKIVDSYEDIRVKIVDSYEGF